MHNEVENTQYIAPVTEVLPVDPELKKAGIFPDEEAGQEVINKHFAETGGKTPLTHSGPAVLPQEIIKNPQIIQVKRKAQTMAPARHTLGGLFMEAVSLLRIFNTNESGEWIKITDERAQEMRGGIIHAN